MRQRFVRLTAILPHPMTCIATGCSNEGTWVEVDQQLFWCDFHAMGEIITPRLEICDWCGLGYSPALLECGMCAYCRLDAPQFVNQEVTQ